MGKDNVRESQDLRIEELRGELEELQARYDFLLAAVDHLPNPIFMKDSDARFFFFNKSYANFFDMKRRDYIGKTVLDLDYLPEDERRRFQEEDLRLIDEQDLLTYDTNFTTSDGTDHPSFYWSRGFIEDSRGRKGLIGEIVDISRERELQQSLNASLKELKAVNDKLQIMAETDYATGLYNRSVLWDKGRELIEDAARSDISTCMIMFDLDHFKDINDEFGHLKGDEILSGFAGILKSESRSTDMPLRYGGDEFVLVLRDISLKDATNVAERIRARSERELILANDRSITISIGVIEVNDDSFESNLSRLDHYLYQAKEQGRNRTIIGD